MTGIAQVFLDSIERRDHSIMHRVHKWPAPKWVRLWMICATRGGDGWLWYVLGAALLVFGGSQGRWAVAQSTIAAAAGIASFLVLKRAAKRKRPCAIEPHCWSTLLPPDQFSFPSGHTITAFAVSTPLIVQYPEAAPGILFCALSIAVSRVITGMHFLSDVVAGGVLGWLLAEAAMRIF
jgi:undecaprenyl-diphosphatase